MSRVSVRVYSKGSGRYEGAAVQVRTVTVQENRVGLCGLCGVWTFAPGLGHGARVAMGERATWPECEHGRRYLEGCCSGPVPPSCCARRGWGVLVLCMLVLNARRVLA